MNVALSIASPRADGSSACREAVTGHACDLPRGGIQPVQQHAPHPQQGEARCRGAVRSYKILRGKPTVLHDQK